MYVKLAIAIAINAVLMFFIMYAMIDELSAFYFNINKVYMTLMMVSPMVIVMIVLMSSMFKNKRLNYALIAISAAVFVLCFAAVRKQTAVGNSQFLRSMIPHHSGAILMCRESEITDPEISRLCDEIVKSQREEIDQMKVILAR